MNHLLSFLSFPEQRADGPPGMLGRFRGVMLRIACKRLSMSVLTETAECQTSWDRWTLADFRE
jgi:hypothetical protein